MSKQLNGCVKQLSIGIVYNTARDNRNIIFNSFFLFMSVYPFGACRKDFKLDNFSLNVMLQTTEHLIPITIYD